MHKCFYSLVIAITFIITGCSSTKNIRLSEENHLQLIGGNFSIVYDQAMKFAVPTQYVQNSSGTVVIDHSNPVNSAIGGAIWNTVMSGQGTTAEQAKQNQVSGEKVLASYGIDDPIFELGRSFGEVISEKYQMKESPDGKKDITLHIKTLDLGFGLISYKHVLIAKYAVSIEKAGHEEVLSQAGCTYISPTSELKLKNSLDEWFENDAKKLRNEISKIQDYCLNEFKNFM